MLQAMFFPEDSSHSSGKPAASAGATMPSCVGPLLSGQGRSPAGTGDDAYRSLVQGIVVPLAGEYRPQLVLISAGYDAHRDDPLADCGVTEEGFAAMTLAIRDAADSVGAPLGCVLEGGYALGALARSVAATMEAMVEAHAVSPPLVADGALVEDARGRLSRWWPVLA